MSKKFTAHVPKVGDTIYVPTALYLSHGRDDFHGGKATVSKVTSGISAGEEVPFISVKERPRTSYNWEFLAEKQADLKARFGDTLSYPDPDYDPQSNEP